MSTNLQLRVIEHHGIRRFLYPLQAEIDWPIDNDIILVDSSGTVVPQHIDRSSPGKATLRFAISMAPNETALLHFEAANGRVPVIPDPLKITTDNGKIRSEQEKVAFEFDESGLLSSVVYDDVEHLAAPLKVTLSNHPNHVAKAQVTDFGGLGAKVSTSLNNDFQIVNCTSSLTCCKSWVEISLQIENTQEYRENLTAWDQNSFLHVELPLRVTSAIQTCDYGFGNGSYGKIKAGDIDWVSARLNTWNKRMPIYHICSGKYDSASEREDYHSSCVSLDDAKSRYWMHWNEPDKAIAIAITQMADCWKSSHISVNTHGNATILFENTDGVLPDDNEVKICYHFLNAIPPIAAATNPASIICKPEVTVEQL